MNADARFFSIAGVLGALLCTPGVEAQNLPSAPTGGGSPVLEAEAAVRPPALAARGLRPTHVSRSLVGSITGSVTSARDQTPLVGVQVYIPDTGIGALTNAQGRYLLINVPAGPQTIMAEIIGYGAATQTVTVVDDEVNILDFQLAERAIELDEVVVTGTAGAQQVRALGNTVGRVDAADVQRIAPQPNMESMLSGSVPSLTVATGDGLIGSGSNIRIRGAGSLALSSQPLIYIDGVRVNNDAAGETGITTGTRRRNPSNRLNDLSPEMIESIEVIKGPAAATLYGTEASNGVINIITKKGAEGAPVFTLSTRVGANFYQDPKTHWPGSWFTCTGKGTHGCTPGEVVHVNVFWEDYVRLGLEHFRTGIPQGYTGSVSGGSQTLQYHFNLDWDADRSPMRTNWQNRLTGRTNLNWTPRDDLTAQFGLGVIRSEMESSAARQPAHTVGFHWSCPGAGCEEGTGLPNALDGPFRGYIAYLPELFESHIDGGQDINRNTFNLQVTHRPMEWLTHRLIAGVDYTENRGHVTVKHLQGGVGISPRQGRAEREFQTTQFLTLDYSGTAEFSPMDGLSLNTSAGIQYYDRTSESLYGRGDRFAVPTLTTVASGEVRLTRDRFLQNKTLGAYVQEQVSWEDRLFLTAAIRGDDNSAFGSDFEFVVYPKVSASWVLSEEEFLIDSDWLNSLRIRGAWGQAGQQPDIFAAAQLYAPVAGYRGEAGVTPLTIGNTAVEPEVGEEIEIGFDLAVLDDRLGIEFTYYDQKRKKALIRLPVRPSTGFPGTQFRNLGEVRNSGLELGVQWDAYRGDALGLHFGLALSTNSNEITDMGGLGPQRLEGINSSTGWAGQRFVEGFPVGAIFLPRVLSATVQNPGPNTGVATNVMCESGAIAWPGTRLTRGGGPAVPCDASNAPEVFWGTPIPTREASLSTTITLFQNVQLFSQFDYVGGHHIIDGFTAAAHSFFRNTRAIHERTDPILLGYDALGAIGSNQGGLFDASIVRLRNVSLSYTIPPEIAGYISADRATLTFSGQNLWMPWRAQKYGFGQEIVEPEARTSGRTSTDPGGLAAYTQDAFPLFKRLLLNLRLTF